MYYDDYEAPTLDFNSHTYSERDLLRDLESLRYDTPQERSDYQYDGGYEEHNLNR